METQIETKEIITPVDNDKVILKSFITGRESREIKCIYSEAVKFRMEGKTSKSESVDMGELTRKTEDKTIEVVVVSVNGIKDNKVDAVLNMNSIDTDFVLKEINKITNGDDFLDKLKPAGSKND